MKYKILLAIQLFFIGYISATVQPSLAQAKDFAAKVSWAFEENKGQVTGKDSAQVKYFYKQGNLTMFLMNSGLAYQFEKFHYPEGYKQAMLKRNSHDYLRILDSLNKLIRRESYRMDIELIGANQNCVIIAEGKSTDYIQYYNHNALGVHAYQKITYKNIYPNIDWVIYQSKEESLKSKEGDFDRNEHLTTKENFKLSTLNFGLKYDFIVHPGGNPSDIKLKTLWTETTKINPDGSLSLSCSMGEIIENTPISFQGSSSIKTEFINKGDYIQFKVDNYNLNQVLVIDPLVRVWATYYGGSSWETFSSCAVDKNGDVVAVGGSSSTTNIASGGYQNTIGGSSDAIVIKFNKNCGRLWATYYGGSQSDGAQGMDIDTAGNIFIVGETLSTSNIASGGFQNTFGNGSSHAFIAKFNSSGTRLWASYYGGNNTSKNPNSTTYVRDCKLDNKGDLIFVGFTTADTLFTHLGHQNAFAYSTSSTVRSDAFIVKFSNSGARLWASYYGGSGISDEEGNGCAVASNGDIYLVGLTSSTSGIAFNGFQDTIGAGAFIAKFNSSGTRLWASYYGGLDGLGFGFALANSCAVDKDGDVYMTGYTNTTSGIGSGGFQNSISGAQNAFLVKFNSSGSRLWGTYYGGSPGNVDYGSICRVDINKNVYLAGLANSNSGIAYNGFKSTHGGGYWDIFLVKFNSAGARQWATYYGGSQIEDPQGLSITNSGDIYISGVTYSSDSSAYNGFQNTHGGQSDALLIKFKDSFCQPTFDTIYDSLCFNTGIWFNGANRFNSGTYFDTLVNAKGCDSFLTLKLFIRPKVSNTINQFICTGQSYLFNGLLRTTSGTYFDTLMNSQGCDSFLTLNLSVKSSDTLHVFDTMCEPQSYFFNNQNLTTSGTYRDTFTSSNGCDSFVFLHLHVKDTSYYSFSHITPCSSNASFMFNGLARTQSGVYSAKYLNALGCDSTAVLNLTIRKPSTPSQFEVRLCPGDSFYFGSVHRKDSGDYPLLLTNSLGCDSLITLRLRPLKKPLPESNTIQACSPFSFLGKTYTSSTIVLDTIKSINGNCDSVFRTNIIQLKPPPTTAPEINNIVCDSIRLNNRLYTTSFSFIDTFRTVGTVCDSVYRKTNYTIRYTPQIGLKERDTFMRGSLVTLRPFSATNYLWSTGETTKNLSFKLTEDRQLYLIAWNEEPCRDTAYISLVAEDLAIVGMPTGFSPTGEHQENRTLRPNINGRLEYFHMLVFNRWGEKVYETFDTQPLGWNGIFKGEPAPAGLYGYVMEYRTLGVIYNKSGEVMLVR